MEYKIETEIKEKTIVQTLLNDKIETLSRWVVDTREASIRIALIKLGWIPPDEEDAEE